MMFGIPLTHGFGCAHMMVQQPEDSLAPSALESRRGGDMSHVPEVLAPFPPSLADNERFWDAGPFTLADFIPLGDGRTKTASIT